MTDMSLSGLTADLAASLSDCAEHVDGQLPALLQTAAMDLARIKRRTLIGQITLQAGENAYDAPADLIGFKAHTWGVSRRQTVKLWQPGYPQVLPSVTITANPAQLHLSFAPTASQIALLGSQFDFYYYASHILSDQGSETTVARADRDLLLLRAQAEVMKVLALRYADKTVSAKLQISGAARIGTPAALRKMLLAEFENRARGAC